MGGGKKPPQWEEPHHVGINFFSSNPHSPCNSVPVHSLIILMISFEKNLRVYIPVPPPTLLNEDKVLFLLEVREKMKKKVIGCVVVAILMVSAILPCVVMGGGPDDPEIEDNVFDVKFVGLWGFFFQFLVKHIDVVSAWFDEDSENPEYLTVCLQTRSLVERTESFEALYKVNWFFNHERYGVILKIHPDGIFAGFEAYKDLGNNEYERHECERIFDVEQGLITWRVAKELIGDLGLGDVLTTTSACALLRPWDATTGEGPDIFKDLTFQMIAPPDERYGEDYHIKY